MKMSKQNLWLLINSGIIIIASLLLLLASENWIPKNPEDLLFGKTVELRNETDIERAPLTGGYAIVDYKVEAYKGDTLLATVYNVKIKNGYTYSEDDEFGFIELLVAIDPAGYVSAQVITLNQSDWTVKGIQNYIYEKYNGILYTAVENIPAYDAADITAGVTATDSTNGIQAIIQKAIDIHYDLIVDDPLIAVYGEGYVKENDSSFVPSTYITKREIIKNASNVELGYIYTLTGTGNYDNGEEIVTGHSITLIFAFDTADSVLAVVIPEDLYGHTGGSRLTKIQSYADLLIGSTVDQFDTVLSNPGDIVSGVTYTKDLVDILVDALVDEVN